MLLTLSIFGGCADLHLANPFFDVANIQLNSQIANSFVCIS